MKTNERIGRVWKSLLSLDGLLVTLIAIAYMGWVGGMSAAVIGSA
jgi:hypothetical protein